MNKEITGANQINPRLAATYAEMAQGIRDIARDKKYARLDMSSIAGAFGNAMQRNWSKWGPYIQNERVKRIGTTPMQYTRWEIEQMLTAPRGSERALRQISRGLTGTSYPYYKLVKLYSDILTYRWMYHPKYITEQDAKCKEFLRERQLVDKICKEFSPTTVCRDIAATTIPDGKGFYYADLEIDKAHGKVKRAGVSQLPIDYCMIVGYNNTSKYTVAFNLMWFFTPGASPEEFPGLFDEYENAFKNSLDKTDSGFKLNVLKASEQRLHFNAANSGSGLSILPNFIENGAPFFWVTLPPEKVFTFGLDDSNPWAAPMFMGLFLSAYDMSNLELIQKQLIQNPLYALITAEIEYQDSKNGIKGSDDTRMSPTMQEYWRTLFYDMMNASNTGGVDLFAAPYKNMELHQFAEVPNANSISTVGYQYFMQKAGASGIIPITEKPLAGSVGVSQKTESRFADAYYGQFSNMMNVILKSANLKYSWDFVMFGDTFSDEKLIDSARTGMTSGILPDAYLYAALRGRTIEDEIAMSIEMHESRLMDLRIPLVTSYTQSAKDTAASNNGEKKAGRPRIEDTDIKSEETEKWRDNQPTN